MAQIDFIFMPVVSKRPTQLSVFGEEFGDGLGPPNILKELLNRDARWTPRSF